MARRRWFIFRRKDRRGPFTAAQLRKLIADGRVKPTDLVQRGGATRAVPAADAGETLAHEPTIPVVTAADVSPGNLLEGGGNTLAFDSNPRPRQARRATPTLAIAAVGVLVVAAVVILVVVPGLSGGKGQHGGTKTGDPDTARVGKVKADLLQDEGKRPVVPPVPKKDAATPPKDDPGFRPPGAGGEAGDPEVRMETSAGVLTIRLMPKAAPLTVAAFLANADAGAFDGTLVDSVHYTGTGAARTPRFLLCGRFHPGMEQTRAKPPEKNEWSERGPPCVRGALTAEHRWQKPDDMRAAFRVHVRDDSRDESVAGRYCVFGRVVAGMEVADRIAAVETRFEPQWSVSMPVKEIRIIRISRSPK